MKSIFQYIESKIMQNGMLDPTFDIGKYKKNQADKPKVADGMIDFIIYSELDVELLKFLKMITKSLTDDTMYLTAKLLDDYFMKHAECRVLGTMDVYLQWVRENKNSFQAELIYKLGCSLMLTAYEIETVKLGVSLLTLFDYNEDEKIIEALEKLSLCEEFTMFTNIVFYNVKNGNDIRFRLAKKLKGFGKIVIVKSLQVENKIIEEWLLCYGCKNEIDNSYLALPIAEKIDLTRLASEKNLTNDEWIGFYEIVSALFDEESMQGISAYNNKNQLFAIILLKYSIWKIDIKYYDLLIKMREYCLKDGKYEATLKKINEIVESEATSDFLKLIIQNPKEMEIGIFVIKELNNMDFRLEVYKAYHENPKEYLNCVSYLLEAKKLREKVVKDWLKVFDLSVYVGEPQPIIQTTKEIFDLVLMIQNLEDYPNLGTEIVLAGLSSTTMYPRNAAIHTIEKWKIAKKNELSKEIMIALKELRKKEVIKSYKEQINKILGIKEDLSNYIEPAIRFNEDIAEEEDDDDQDYNYENEIYLDEEVNLFDGDISPLFRDVIVIRGENYYENGMVRQCIKQNKKYIAFVQGSQIMDEYNVIIKVDNDNNIVSLSCTCPCTENCKHEYAVLLYIREKYWPDDI